MKNDLICFSHLRWHFVYQRPQHLMTRFAKNCRVFYVEEPVYENHADRMLMHVDEHTGVQVVVPSLQSGESPASQEQRLKYLLNEWIGQQKITDFVTWYYAPMALEFTDHLNPVAIVYDCMDELSAFQGAPPALIDCERRLMKKADLVFTGGHRLYEAKKHLHDRLFPFPSSIDKTFFYPARANRTDPEDQSYIPRPRLGFFGVIDERFDIELVRKMANLKPDWQFIFIGPVVKIDPATLPRSGNIYWLGMKDYQLLPAYISGWDLCIMPFAINAATEFISPTKTPEFLAAGKRVISTPIHDVIHPYGVDGLVSIAATAEEFVDIATQDLKSQDNGVWLGKVDHFLSTMSWDKTWSAMQAHLEPLLKKASIHKPLNEKSYV